MRNLLIFFLASTAYIWAVSKPMESIENYNVMIVHGAYSACQGFWIERDSTSCEEFLAETDTNEAYFAKNYLGDASLGAYDNGTRITKWISKKVFEEPELAEKVDYAHNSYVYNWRSFSNPANTSLNNAHELGDRTWSLKDTRFKQRRALFEEAQEVKAKFLNPLKPSENKYGQEALDSIRNHSDFYRQLASRYILIGHSMGGVVSREYVQGNFYNGDVDKIITLDSPH